MGLADLLPVPGPWLSVAVVGVVALLLASHTSPPQPQDQTKIRNSEMLGEPLNEFCEARMPNVEEFVAPSVKARLASIQIITRHGDRTPLTPVPKQDAAWRCEDGELSVLNGLFSRVNYDDSEFEWPFDSHQGNCAPGQITIRGVAQHVKLGQRIRETYGSKISIVPKSVAVRSTSVARTLRSAQAFLSGLLGEHVTSLNDPIVVQISRHNKRGDVLLPSTTCQRFVAMMNVLEQTPAWKAHIQNNREFRNRLDRIFSEPAKGEAHNQAFYHFYDQVSARVCHNQPMPCVANGTETLSDCLTDHDKSEIVRLAEWEWDYWYYQIFPQDKARIESGPLLHVISSSLLAVLAEESSKTIRLFSGHDETIAPVLAALGIKSGWPPYASSIILELWDPSSYDMVPFIRLRYNGRLYRFAPCNEFECSLDRFMNFIQSWANPSGFAENCARELTTSDTNHLAASNPSESRTENVE